MPTNRGTEGESPEIRNYCRKCQGIALEVRAAAEGEDSRTIGGYAVKYNTPVLIVDRWGDKYLEEIAAGCFDESLNSCKEAGKEIKALWNHDTSRPLGSTKTDTLRFNTADTTGLAYDIDLPNNTWGNDVKESVQRGDVDGSSFGFICQEDRWSKVVHEGEEIYKRTIDNNAAILPEQFVNDIQVLREGFPSLKEHCHIVRATSNHGKMPFAKIGGKKLTKYKSGTKLTGEAANTQDISYNIENYGALVPIANDLQEDEAVNIIQDVIKPDFAEAGVNSENDEILQIVEDNATDKSTGVTDWRGVKKVIDGVLPTLRAKTVVITNLTGYVYLQSQEDKNGRNLDLVKTVNGKDYFQNRQLITLSDEAVTASATGKVVFYVVNLYALVKFFERKGYTVSTDKSVFFESDETALKVQERFDCEKLDDRADFKVEFTPAA